MLVILEVPIVLFTAVTVFVIHIESIDLLIFIRLLLVVIFLELIFFLGLLRPLITFDLGVGTELVGDLLFWPVRRKVWDIH